ncbi:MAG: DUF6057 family protein, partial [Tannerella sp.]|nr:DUF6057 family protein [Tannerella sp.]
MRNFEKVKTQKSAHSDYEALFRKGEQKWYRTLFSKLNTPVIFWFCVFWALFLYLQTNLGFHFYYIEQEQLFLWDRTYWSAIVMEPAGLVRYITEFFIQFFIHPYCGALIMSALFVLIGILTAGIIKRMAPTANLFLLSLLPIILLLYLHFDINYYYRGTMAYVLMLLVMYGYFYISHLTIRVLYVTLFGILLFWWAGAVSVLFVVCVFLWEIMNRFIRAYWFILPLLVVTSLTICSVYLSWVGDYRLILIPDGYFTYRLRPGIAIYFSWIFLPIILILCRLMRHRKNVGNGLKFLEMFIQLCLLGVVFWFGMSKFANRSSDFYKELDYYIQTGQWDQIKEKSTGEIKNYLYLCCLNLALAEKGELADRMFSFDQRG